METTQHKKREERKHKKKTPDRHGEVDRVADPNMYDDLTD